MKFIDTTIKKKPKWLRTGIKCFPYVLVCKISGRTRVIDGKCYYSEPVQWLVDNLSTKGGCNVKKYKYIHRLTVGSRFPTRCGVAFIDIEDAMAFKMMFIGVCGDIKEIK